MDLKDILQKNLANIKSKLPQLPSLPRISKLNSRKIFTTHRYSKENISSLQNPNPSTTIIDRTPMKISTISSLVDDNTSQHYRSEQNIAASSSTINSKPFNNGENNHHVRFAEKLTKTYKELSEFKFRHIFGKKTIVRRTEIQLDLYKSSFDEEQEQSFRRMSNQSQFDIEVIALPTGRLSVPCIPENSPINRTISPTFISYPAPQNNDEIISVPTPPLTRRKIILPAEIEPIKSNLWKNKKNKINNSIDSEISKEVHSEKNSLRSTNESRKSTGMWKVQRAILIKAPKENENEEKSDSRTSSAVKSILKKMSSRGSIDDNKNDETTIGQGNLWQRSIKRKIAPMKEENQTENENETVANTRTIDTSVLKTKINDILDKSSSKIKHFISKEPENMNAENKERDDCVEENPEKAKSMDEIEQMGYGKKNLKLIERWKVRRRREIRRTKPFPIDPDNEMKRKKIRGMWNIQRPIRTKINLNEKDLTSDSKTMQSQLKDFRNVVIKAWKTKITPQSSVDSISNETELIEPNTLKIKKQYETNQYQSNVIVFEERNESNNSSKIRTRIKNKTDEKTEENGNMLSEKTSLTDSYKTTIDNLNDENETSTGNQTWKMSSIKANEYSSSDSEDSIDIHESQNEYFAANRNDPTVIILNKPLQSVEHLSSPKATIHLSVPVPLPLPTPPLPIKFASPSKEIFKLAMTSDSKNLEHVILTKFSDVSNLSKYIDDTCNSDTSTLAFKYGHKRKYSINLNDTDCWTTSNSFDRRHSVAVLSSNHINDDMESSENDINITETENILRKWRSVDIFNDDEKETPFADFDAQLKNVPIFGIHKNPISIDQQEVDEFKSLEYFSLLDENKKSDSVSYESKLNILNEIGFEKNCRTENNVNSPSGSQLSISLEKTPELILTNLSSTLDMLPPPLPLELPPPLPLILPPSVLMESFEPLDIMPILIPSRPSTPEPISLENEYKSSTSSANSSVIMSPEPTGIPIQKIKVSRPVVKTESLRRQFSDECEAKDLKKLNVNKLISQFECTEVNQIPEKHSIINTFNVSKLIEDNNNNIKINQFTPTEISKIKLDKSLLKINHSKYESLLNANIAKSINTNIERNMKSVEPPPINPRKKLQTKQIVKSINKDEEIFYSIDNYDDDSQLYSLGEHSIIKELYTIDL